MAQSCLVTAKRPDVASRTGVSASTLATGTKTRRLEPESTRQQLVLWDIHRRELQRHICADLGK